jgi:hypothetical protein
VKPQAIETRNRSQDEPMAGTESGETYSGIKFKQVPVDPTALLPEESLPAELSSTAA